MGLRDSVRDELAGGAPPAGDRSSSSVALGALAGAGLGVLLVSALFGVGGGPVALLGVAIAAALGAPTLVDARRRRAAAPPAWVPLPAEVEGDTGETEALAIRHLCGDATPVRSQRPAA